ATCATCQTAHAQWRTITTTLQSAAQAAPPPPSDAALWAALGPRVRAEGGHLAVLDAPSRNGHSSTAEADLVPQTSARVRPPAAPGPRRQPRGYAIVAAVAVVALLVVLFSALASHRVTTTPAQPGTPTATPIALPAALSIPNNVLATATIGGTNFWIGGDNLLAYYDGQGGWQKTPLPAGSIIESIAMVTPTEGWAVGYTNGQSPLLLHNHGGTWQSVALPSVTDGLKQVRMASADDGWAWGNGVLLRYSGGQWIEQATPFPPLQIRDLAVVAPGEAWASSVNTLWHFHDGNWTADADLGTFSVAHFSMISPTEGWASGYIGGLKHFPVVNDVWHYDGKVWSRVNPAPDLLNDTIFGIDQLFIHRHDDGWASVVENANKNAPNNGHILRYHAGQWTQVAIPVGMWVHDVLTLGPDDAWAIGTFTSGQQATFAQLLHYQGGIWHTK
nr:hypothetical protein [Ktedonobacterales bacterium]